MTTRIRGLSSYRPEPGRWWIRHSPSAWPAAGGLWTDLARRSVGEAGAGPLPTFDPGALEDVVYLPPADAASAAEAEALAERLAAASVPLVRQWTPPPGGGEPPRTGDVVVVDLLALLLENEGLDGLESLPSGHTAAVWPLIPGVTAEAELWERGLEVLAERGFTTVLPQIMELSPAQRRRLGAYAGDAAFQLLFHGGPPESRDFARAAAACGLATTPQRPGVEAAPRFAFRRRAATELIVAADLWLRLGRSEVTGQELLRAARWAEETDHDLRAAALEGNLGVVPWLDDLSREVIADLAADATDAAGSSLRAELERELREGP